MELLQKLTRGEDCDADIRIEDRDNHAERAAGGV